jgi:transposase
MNKSSPTRRAQILGMMVEGVSIRAISRMTGASKNTIVKLQSASRASQQKIFKLTHYPIAGLALSSVIALILET